MTSARGTSGLESGSKRDFIMTRKSQTDSVSTASVDEDKGSLEELARSALLESVENSIGVPTNANPTLALDDDGAVPVALLQLFSSGNDRQKLREGLSVRDQKQLLFKAIRTLPKATARRFFAGLYGHVNAIIQRESYLPDSAYPGEEEDDRENDGSLIEVTPDPASSVALQFLCCAALCVQAYLDETIASKRHNDDPSARKVPIHIKIPVIAEVYQIAKAMHDVLLTLNSAGSHLRELNKFGAQKLLSSIAEKQTQNLLLRRGEK